MTTDVYLTKEELKKQQISSWYVVYWSIKVGDKAVVDFFEIKESLEEAVARYENRLLCPTLFTAGYGPITESTDHNPLTL
jgi:hypothetical protein